MQGTDSVGLERMRPAVRMQALRHACRSAAVARCAAGHAPVGQNHTRTLPSRLNEGSDLQSEMVPFFLLCVVLPCALGPKCQQFSSV